MWPPYGKNEKKKNYFDGKIDFDKWRKNILSVKKGFWKIHKKKKKIFLNKKKNPEERRKKDIEGSRMKFRQVKKKNNNNNWKDNFWRE